jgi:hypothetical protein
MLITPNKRKKILIIRQSEPISINDRKARKWRANLIHEYCSAAHEETILITSTFDHYTKKQRFNRSTFRIIDGNKYYFIKTPGYYKNQSIARLFDHSIFGFKVFFYLIASRKEIKKIFTSFPTIEAAFFSIVFGKINKTPVIVDVRDLWPDLFFDFAKGSVFKTVALRLFFFPYSIVTRLVFSLAEVVTAPTYSYLEWSKEKSFLGTKAKKYRILPMAYPDCSDYDSQFIHELNKRVKGQYMCVFIGTLNQMFDFDPLKDAASINSHVSFIIAGDGDNKKQLETNFSQYNNVHFIGWINQREICTLMQHSHFGLAPYIDINNFSKHVPNKIIEYMSESLIILYSVKGEIDTLLHSCGVRYENGLSLGDSIKKITESPKVLKKKSYNTGLLYKNNFSANKVYKDFVDNFLL